MNTKSLGAICPATRTLLLSSTACVSLRPTILSPNHASGISSVGYAKSRRPMARLSPTTWYVPSVSQHDLFWLTQFADPRETSSKGQELRYLDSIRQPIWHSQHVQGIPRDEPYRRSRGTLPGHGCATPCSLSVNSRAQGSRD